MKRVKTPKKSHIQITPKELERIKREVTKSATDKATLLVLCATADEIGLSDEQLCDIMERVNRYAGYIDEHVVKLRDVQKSLENNIDVKLSGW